MSGAPRTAWRWWWLAIVLAAGRCDAALAQAAAPAAPPAASPAAKPPAPEHTVEQTPATVLGQDVHGTDGKSIGRIIDVLVDQTGHPLAAVVDFGGFMGLGNRKIAVGWDDLRFDPKSADHSVTVDLSTDQLKAAPDYKGAAAKVTVVGTPAPPPAPAPTPRPSPPPPSATPPPAAPPGTPDTKPD